MLAKGCNSVPVAGNAWDSIDEACEVFPSLSKDVVCTIITSCIERCNVAVSEVSLSGLQRPPQNLSIVVGTSVDSYRVAASVFG